jgi:hypothetical protein
MNTAITKRFSALSLACLLTLMLLGGCSGNPFSTSSSQMGASDLGQMYNKVGDFDDIELPMEMKWSSDESMAIRTDSFEGGILTYSGRVELSSLKQYIISAMENKKWKLVGEAQSENILLAFTKPSKTCMVVLEEGLGGKYGYTKATLYVTVDVAAAGRLNPFGEPIN